MNSPSIFFGRNVEADTKESVTVGHTEINLRPMRVKVNELRDSLNQLELYVITTLTKEEHQELRHTLVDNIKKSIRLLQNL